MNGSTYFVEGVHCTIIMNVLDLEFARLMLLLAGLLEIEMCERASVAELTMHSLSCIVMHVPFTLYALPKKTPKEPT